VPPRPAARAPAVLPSPNIWHWPAVYEVENAAQDAHDAVWTVLGEVAPWAGLDVVDVGCGAGFHLPRFAGTARTVVGVEPHPPLVELARARTDGLGRVHVLAGTGERLPLPDARADVVHARTACFFGPGCEPAVAEAERVLRPGGVLVVVDLDATRGPYGEWMRTDLPRYDPVAAERFFADRGFGLRRVDTTWRFADRAALRSVLGIEFSARVADRAFERTPGLTLDVAYRVHWRRTPGVPGAGAQAFL
jgi:SAM-dependent methyltransferase